MAHDWLVLCIKMMVALAPQNIDTWSEYNRYQELSVHFTSISTHLSERIKAKNNIKMLSFEETDETRIMAQTMNRLTQSGVGFAKAQVNDCKNTANTAIQKYEELLCSGKISNKMRLHLEKAICELREVFENLEG